MHVLPRLFPHTERDWMRALEDERLIDVREWCDGHRLESPLPPRTVMTRAVCDAIDRIPFRLVQQVTARERGAALFARAAALLARRAEKASTQGPFSFSAALPCRAEDRRWRPLLLRSEELGSLGSVHIVALETETARAGLALSQPAPWRAAAPRPCGSDRSA
jgi:hypothetical protein